VCQPALLPDLLRIWPVAALVFLGGFGEFVADSFQGRPIEQKHLGCQRQTGLPPDDGNVPFRADPGSGVPTSRGT
jgi:hypothetical protein